MRDCREKGAGMRDQDPRPLPFQNPFDKDMQQGLVMSSWPAGEVGESTSTSIR